MNTPITLSATATGGANVQYQFWIYNSMATPAWSQWQGYSPSASCTWMPVSAGNYLISATAMDGTTGAVVNTTAWYNITSTLLTAVTAATDPASPQQLDTPITLTATATGGVNVQYQFWVYQPERRPGVEQLQARTPPPPPAAGRRQQQAITCSPSPRRTASPA